MPHSTFGPPGRVLNHGGRIGNLLDVLLRQLRMDAAVFSSWDGDVLVVQAVGGDAQSFGLAPGTTVNRNKVDIRPPGSLHVVSDTSKDRRTMNSKFIRDIGIGSFVSASLHDTDGELYGMIMCMSHGPRPALRDRDARFLCQVTAFLRQSLIDLRRTLEVQCRVWESIGDLIDRGGPNLVFQPVVRLATNAVVGLEALSRFPDRCAGRRLGTQDWFMDAATVGLDNELELAAIRGAVPALVDLPSDVYLAVNASPITVTGGLPDVLRDTSDPDRLVVEITEHENFLDNPEFLTSVACLRDRGVRIAVDDTGTGYAGLEQLLQLRPEVVKLDIMISRGISSDPARRALAAGLLHLAKEMGAIVVAEGIETQAQRRALVEAGIEYGQGIMLGPPVPDAQVACSRGR